MVFNSRVTLPVHGVYEGTLVGADEVGDAEGGVVVTVGVLDGDEVGGVLGLSVGVKVGCMVVGVCVVGASVDGALVGAPVAGDKVAGEVVGGSVVGG